MSNYAGETFSDLNVDMYGLSAMLIIIGVRSSGVPLKATYLCTYQHFSILGL